MARSPTSSPSSGNSPASPEDKSGESQAPSGAPNTVKLAGQVYWPNAQGGLTPEPLIRETDRLQDDVVRRIRDRAEALNAAIADFNRWAYGEIDAFREVLADRFQVTAGGQKGNISLSTFDGCVQVLVQVNDLITFGPELQVAQQLVADCVADWLVGARAELAKIALDAFNTDKEGQINRGRLLGLLKYDITDERWIRAMTAIRESIRPIGSKRYVRVRHRRTVNDAWSTIALNSSKA